MYQEFLETGKQNTKVSVLLVLLSPEEEYTKKKETNKILHSDDC
jgi:hypothetical protein